MAARRFESSTPSAATLRMSAGFSETYGIEYRVAKMPMAAVLRTRTLSEPRGLIKMPIDKTSDRILGFTVFGAEASELMARVQTATLGQLPFAVLRDAIFTHPTAAEALTVLLADVTGSTLTTRMADPAPRRPCDCSASEATCLNISR
jgi:pyruvate/2-oxoglutarate dehydrogenase complex dihydrolipoamide dehydrogenase (E3) component